MAEQHPVDYLFSKMITDINPYCPEGVAPIQERIRGIAFFPGGPGLWNVDRGSDVLPPMPIGKIMVLGQDFDKVSSYTRSLTNFGEDIDGPTWGPLRCLLRDVSIQPELCFFTNAYMGLGLKSRATGKFPGATDSFRKHCQAFLKEQIKVQKPRLILTLGNHVRESCQCSMWAWAKPKNLGRGIQDCTMPCRIRRPDNRKCGHAFTDSELAQKPVQ